MLVNEDYGDILPFLCEVVECPFDSRGFGLRVNHEEVPL